MSGTEQHADPDAYLRETTAPPGSTLYYCTLFVPGVQARRSIALEAFRRELDDVVDDCREPVVAAARIGWWQGELQRVADGGAQHPVTRVLSEVLAEDRTAPARLTAAVAATAAATSHQSWPVPGRQLNGQRRSHTCRPHRFPD